MRRATKASDSDIDCTAALVVKRHGDEAPIHTAMRADELMAEASME